MCAQFEIEKNALTKKLKALNLSFEDLNDKIRVLPHSVAPTIIQKNGNLTFQSMNFSLIPHWSKEKKPKFSTHNARVETIKNKPTWRSLFGKKHCLVPLTSFIEPIYEGEYAGHMVRFLLPECFLVPGIFDIWHDKLTGETIESFAIITSEPSEFIAKTGHDRSPIFLSHNDTLLWLTSQDKTDTFFFNLLSQKISPNFSIKIDRKLKLGWESRR